MHCIACNMGKQIPTEAEAVESLREQGVEAAETGTGSLLKLSVPDDKSAAELAAELPGWYLSAQDEEHGTALLSALPCVEPDSEPEETQSKSLRYRMGKRLHGLLLRYNLIGSHGYGREHVKARYTRTGKRVSDKEFNRRKRN